MRWIKKLKKQYVAKKQQRHDQKVLNKYRTAGLASQCMNCKHLVYREEKPRNWVCRCPDEKLRFIGNTCLGFEFGDHPKMTVIFSKR